MPKLLTEKSLRERIARLDRHQLEECVADVCIYLYGHMRRNSEGFLFSGEPCETGEELDMVQTQGLIQFLVDP